jgi:molybdopterin molybdotransferase
VKLLTVDTIGEAREKLLARLASRPLKTETLDLDEPDKGSGPDAANRVLAEDVYASDDIPGFRRSTVDGYALLAADTAGAGEAIPVFLKLAGSVCMGKPADFSIRSGECAYVPTGAMLPAGADAVVMVEYTEAAPGLQAAPCRGGGGNIAVYEALAPGAGTAEAGEDLRKGDLLLRKGTLLRPQEEGALAAAGVRRIKVFSRLRLSLISTGDELVPPDKQPRSGEIRDINTHALKALAAKRGYCVVSSRVIPDSEDLLDAALTDAMAASDVVVISGGSSQGEKDLSAAAIDRVASPGVFTHGLAIKPGKPTILGWDEERKILLAGLPGHPVSAMMVFELLLAWLTNELFGKPAPLPVPARLSCNLPGSPGKTVCQPVILHPVEGGYLAEPVFGKSGMITTLTRADGYIMIDLNKEGLKQGEAVLVHLF